MFIVHQTNFGSTVEQGHKGLLAKEVVDYYFIMIVYQNFLSPLVQQTHKKDNQTPNLKQRQSTRDLGFNEKEF